MAECDICGSEVSFPYKCNSCGNLHCSDHRLPESHDCPSLHDDTDATLTRNDGETSSGGGLRDSLPSIGTGHTGPLAGFRHNMTFVFLGLMWITFLAQALVATAVSREVAASLFVLRATHVEYVWTWFTSIFAHGGLMHILFNSLVLYFFGPVVERRIGTKRFTVLFLVTGAAAGLAQVGTAIALGNASAFSGVVGASGSIAAIMGTLTVLNPSMRVYLWFLIPLPLWVVTTGFVAYSAFVSLTGGIAAGGVAQLAHLAGAVLGLVYGVKIKREDVNVPNQLQFGGGGGPGGPGMGGGPGGRF